MTNIISWMKSWNPNVHALIITIFMAIWFNGIGTMINIFLPNRGIGIGALMLIIPLIVFLLDNELDEFGLKNTIIPINTNLADQPSTKPFEYLTSFQPNDTRSYRNLKGKV